MGFLTFVAALLVHILWWRITPPRKQILFLFLIFILVPVLVTLCIMASASLSVTTAFGSLVLALSCGAVYVITYPAAQAQSPTLILLLFLAEKAPKGGANREEIYQFFTTRSTLADRWSDLEKDGLATDSGHSLQGKFLTKFFLYLRSLLNIREAG